MSDCIGNLTKSSNSDLCFANHSRLLFFFSCLRNVIPSCGKPLTGGYISESSSSGFRTVLWCGGWGLSTAIFDCGSYKAACFIDPRLCLAGGNTQRRHYDRGFHMPARLEEPGRGCRIIEPSGDHYDSFRTLLELSA